MTAASSASYALSTMRSTARQYRRRPLRDIAPANRRRLPTLGAATITRPRIGLVGVAIAGVETQYRNLLRAVELSGAVEPLAVTVEPYRRDAMEWVLPFLPASLRGTLRSVGGTAPLFLSQVDAVWTQIDLPLLPWLLTVGALRRVRLVYTADSTPRLLRGFGHHYGHWGGRSRVKARLRDGLHAACLHRAALVNPWTEWAARSMREDYGVPPERVRVVPPGVDTEFWRPVERPAGRVPRAIFVGGDFIRKGGDLLLAVFRERFRGRLELDLVTRSEVQDEEGVRVHSGIGPNDTRLRRLYQEADFLVIPTRADCFSMAGLEAMSSGLPVITSRVGGVGELLDDGREGFLVPPDDGRSLGEAIQMLVVDPRRRARMGAAARALAAARYDAHRNASLLLSLLTEDASCD
ncbi:MAG TPA: glycosyltransferase family 4 protein [Candidatus Dormibacteraeota bacterium]|nr:glycosyltransferase family 4 protein [Candidatus Dormibacteraeota bacterium]